MIGRVWRTVRHLRGRQIVYQVLYRLRGRPRLPLPVSCPEGWFLTVPMADKPVTYTEKNGRQFQFLNQSVLFRQRIDWNYAPNGKLWTYQLNAFDFLNQPGLTAEQGLLLMRDFMAASATLRDGLEPYPTSLRLMNWIQFLSRHQLQDERINAHLLAQATLLRRRLEYHLLGNHLLENGFALLTAALFFRRSDWFRQASALLRTELSVQVLADGGHEERSPTYHQTLLDRLLDLCLYLQHDRSHGDRYHTDAGLLPFLTERAGRMLGWLRAITFANGDVPMVNDAAWHVAPTTAHLLAKTRRLGWPDVPAATLSDSGYRMLTGPRYQLLADVGAVGPDHQPGHAHADTLAFVLYVDGRPVLVDAGTSTYQAGPRRAWERSTAAHNTVSVEGQNSSEVWATFRVGRRARAKLLTDTDSVLKASHNGYAQRGIRHERTWATHPTEIRITDRLAGLTAVAGTARYYVHPDVAVSLTGAGAVIGPIEVVIVGGQPTRVQLETYEMATGFNQRRAGYCLRIDFVTYVSLGIYLYK